MTGGPSQALVRELARSYIGYYAMRGITVNEGLADEQQLAYVRALEKTGLRVSLVDTDEALPDCVFIEDTAVVWNQQALITRMWREREGEQAAVEAVLRQTHSIVRLPPEATLDGGDVLHVNETTYVGLSGRTNQAGAQAVADFLSQFGRRVVQVPVQHCLHLKTGVTSLGDGTLLAVPGWFDMRLFDVTDVIYTDPSEPGAANCLRIRDHLLVPDGYPITGKRLQEFADRHGIQITRLAISEFEKGGGGLTCLSIVW
jgi:dimethylargininase